MGDLIGKFHPAPKADHFGLITFHNKATLAFNFANTKYHDKNALLNRILKEPIKLELQTRTDLALKMARDELFTVAGGDRHDKPNVMIVFTDGRPTRMKAEAFKKFAEDISKEFKVRGYTGCLESPCLFFRYLTTAKAKRESSPACIKMAILVCVWVRGFSTSLHFVSFSQFFYEGFNTSLHSVSFSQFLYEKKGWFVCVTREVLLEKNNLV